MTAAPAVGVGVTALRGVGADSDRIRSVFAGPRFGIAMAPRVANGSPAVFAARSWGAHLAVYVDPGSAWQIAVGYEWGR